jgi:hypothetical protein
VSVPAPVHDGRTASKDPSKGKRQRNTFSPGGATPRMPLSRKPPRFIRAYAAEQARINAETARRLDALERDKAERDRRAAALEDRQARVVGFVQGIAGVFSLVARG